MVDGRSRSRRWLINEDWIFHRLNAGKHWRFWVLQCLLKRWCIWVLADTLYNHPHGYFIVESSEISADACRRRNLNWWCTLTSQSTSNITLELLNNNTTNNIVYRPFTLICPQYPAISCINFLVFNKWILFHIDPIYRGNIVRASDLNIKPQTRIILSDSR